MQAIRTYPLLPISVDLSYLETEEATGPFTRELDKAVNELKESEEGRQEYMMLMTYGAEQKAAGKYIRNVELIRGWYEDHSSLPVSDAAKVIRVTVPQFESVVALIKDNPELTDDDIAKKVSWRK